MDSEQDKIKLLIIENKSSNPLPTYASIGASGMDIRTNIGDLSVEELENRLGSGFEVDTNVETDKPFILLEPFGRYLFPTGLYMQLPVGYEAQLRPRSGLAIKQGLTVLNTPGTVDADYRGEIGIILINLSNKQVVIEHGERICQLVVAATTPNGTNPSEFYPIFSGIIDDTERGAGGFGHTGTK